jgi:ABC-type amino acid transport substrate-binding protein
MSGFEPKYEFGNGVRDSLRRYQAGRVDAVSNLFDSMAAKGCRTDPVFRFSDVVISKRKDKRRVESLADLEGLSIVAFDGARGFFGEEYTRYTLSGSYLEVGKQALQPRLLLSDRYDVNIGDLFIFLYGLEQIISTKVAPKEFQVHDLFPAISTRMGFRDESLCPLFNAALVKVKTSGEYERIYQRYLDELGFQR